VVLWIHLICVQGRIQDLGLEAAKSSAEGARTEFFGSQTGYFGAFSGPSSVCFCSVIRQGPYLHYACPLWHSRLTVARSKALEFCRRGYWTLSSLVVNMTTSKLHDDGYSYSFSSDGHQFGGHGPLAPLWIRHCLHRFEVLDIVPLLRRSVLSLYCLAGLQSVLHANARSAERAVDSTSGGQQPADNGHQSTNEQNLHNESAGFYRRRWRSRLRSSVRYYQPRR